MMLRCQKCGGVKEGNPRPFICDTCAGSGYEPLLRVAPRAEGHPRLYYGYMNLVSQEKDGMVDVYCGDDAIKPVLRAFTEAKGGIHHDDAIVLTALIPVEALKAEASLKRAA
jgi:hypothetical protein